MLILDDDHEYDAHVVDAYATALRKRPNVAFTVQSPPSQLRFAASFPIAFGSRGVGVKFDTVSSGRLADYAEKASEIEPTCRIVDDIVVSRATPESRSTSRLGRGVGRALSETLPRATRG